MTAQQEKALLSFVRSISKVNNDTVKEKKKTAKELLQEEKAELRRIVDLNPANNRGLKKFTY